MGEIREEHEGLVLPHSTGFFLAQAASGVKVGLCLMSKQRLAIQNSSAHEGFPVSRVLLQERRQVGNGPMSFAHGDVHLAAKEMGLQLLGPPMLRSIFLNHPV